MNIGLLVIGDEILSGKRADKHLPKVIELLAARGLQLAWARFVGDDPVRITAELGEAFASLDLVFSCGGIGATPDDHTRQCAAAALGVALELHPEAAALVVERMRDVAREQGQPFDPERADNRHRLNMAVFPAGAEIIPNSYNKIAGFAVRERSVIVFGGMEAALTPLMEAVEREFAGVKVFSLPSVDHPELGRHIELGVKGNPALLEAAYLRLREGARQSGATLGAELVR
jgi:molybdopterin-biosynthesis enzyme MoeA-like protein